jgi:quinol monooxygenase YgiN
MIHVLATIRLHPGRRAAFLQEFAKLVPLVHAEAGCIEYGAAIDTITKIPAQINLGADAVMVVEKWENVAALAAHLEAPHMNDYRARVNDFVERVDLQMLEPASS